MGCSSLWDNAQDPPQAILRIIRRRARQVKIACEGPGPSLQDMPKDRAIEETGEGLSRHGLIALDERELAEWPLFQNASHGFCSSDLFFPEDYSRSIPGPASVEKLENTPGHFIRLGTR